MKMIILMMISLSLLQAQYIRDTAKEVVLDTTTNLMWQDDDESVGDANKKTWSDAIAYCEAKTLGGYSDWRLANFNELYSLADNSKYAPAISSVFQNVVSSSYWSSTTYASDTSRVWYVHFNGGTDYTSDKTNTQYIRCVR